MRSHVEPSKEVTVGTAMTSRGTLAGQADPRPVIGSRRNPDIQGLSLRASRWLRAIEIDSLFGAEGRFVEVKGK